MSHLLGHTRAARFLADAFTEEFLAQGDDPQLAALAAMLAHGFGTAADRMQQAMRDEAGPGVGREPGT